MTKTRSWQDMLTMLALPVYFVFAYGWAGEDNDFASALLTASLSYFLALYVYYTIAKLALDRRFVLITLSGILAVIVGGLFVDAQLYWIIFIDMCMFLTAGILTGWMISDGKTPEKTYIIGAIAIAVLFSIGHYHIWPTLMTGMAEQFDRLTKESIDFLIASGYSPEKARDTMIPSGKMFDALIRIAPASTVMSAILQFTIGYLIFCWQTAKKHPMVKCWVPFTKWRVPFAVTPVLIVMAISRLLGGETLQMIADNVLFCLAIYYCITGLSLVEYFLNKMKISLLMKIVFYIMLILTQFIGFFIATLLGFIDSFTDWRRSHELRTT